MTTNRMLEGEFYHYMASSGQVSAEENRRVLESYVRHFVKCEHVLDVGCGEGQFIESARAQGINASGVDSDVQMVRVCREKGLNVVEANLFDYLPQQKRQFDGIFSSNVLEHLSVQDALRFLQLSFDALRPGGVLLVATPNPESLIVHLHEFWRDATHVRLYNRSLLEFLLSWSGFCDIQSGGNSKTVWTPPTELRAVPELLEDLAAWGESRLLGPATVSEAVTELEGAERERPFWRRVGFLLRRRLARFLVRTVLFEEFAAIEAKLASMSVTSRRAGLALYHSLSELLTVPREVFAKGTKPEPASGREESG
jgi:SAM-dependent methyltransferase